MTPVRYPIIGSGGMMIVARNLKKLKDSKKPCYSFEVLVCTPYGEMTVSRWRYWPVSGHIEPPSVLAGRGYYKPSTTASGGVRQELGRQLAAMSLEQKQQAPVVSKPVPGVVEEPVWEEYGFTREEWYALEDGTVVAHESVPEHCDHTVVGGKLVKRYETR